MVLRLWNRIWFPLCSLWPDRRMVWSAWLRYSAVHIPVGSLNFGFAGLLYYGLGVHEQLASGAGHALHMTLAFFLDRSVTHKSRGTPIASGATKYLVTDAISYVAVAIILWYFVTLLEYEAGMVRMCIAMPVATVAKFLLDWLWTFAEHREAGQ